MDNPVPHDAEKPNAHGSTRVKESGKSIWQYECRYDVIAAAPPPAAVVVVADDDNHDDHGMNEDGNHDDDDNYDDADVTLYNVNISGISWGITKIACTK